MNEPDCEMCDEPCTEPAYSVSGAKVFCSPSCRTEWERSVEDGPDDDPDAWSGGFAPNH